MIISLSQHICLLYCCIELYKLDITSKGTRNCRDGDYFKGRASLLAKIILKHVRLFYKANLEKNFVTMNYFLRLKKTK